ncbi:MAG: phosphatase PAP2 family protein [Pseudonocardiaceae bacterium]|nr:phosphatase PAP2 family protein [Pseudonocardiaceae bacterium]
MLARISASLRRVSRTDLKLVERSSRLPPSAADRVLKGLGRSANHGVLWLVIAGVLSSKKGASRRAGLRGVAAIAGASTSANLVGKNVFPRRRPAAELVPEDRRLSNRPVSSSFPSGHAASAVAFTTAAALECPPVALAVAPLAAAVAYSRVHTGVHWPSDTAAGALIGALAAFGTQHWWPRRPDTPAHTAHRVEAPALPHGEGLLLFANPGSGDPDVDPVEEASARWPQAIVVEPDPDTPLSEQLDIVRADTGREITALGVAGGDGTVAAVATLAARRGLPLVLVPAGTLNHFARDVGVESMPEAANASHHGWAVGVDLGSVDVQGSTGDTEARWFVNTASLGGYPTMVRLRAVLEPARGKWLGAAIALARTLRKARPIPVRLNGKRQLIWMLFVGNGSYAPKGFAPTSRPALDTGLLDIRYLRADVPYSRARFVLAALTRTLNASHVYRQLDRATLDMRLLEGATRIATDGELGPLGQRFVFRARPSALTIYRPLD